MRATSSRDDADEADALLHRLTSDQKRLFELPEFYLSEADDSLSA